MKNVAIVGGGLAGLTALYELKKHDINATLFESSDHVGGRIKTLRYDNDIVDVGVIYFHKYYTNFLGLVRELGLENNVKQYENKRIGFVNNDRTVLLELYELLRSVSIIDVLSLLKLTWDVKRNALKNSKVLQRYAESSVTEFPGLLDEYKEDFGNYARERTPLVKEKILGPFCKWTLFSPPEDWNYFIGMAILLPMTTPLLKFDGGMDTVTNTLYEQLKDNIKLETPVKSVEKLHDGYGLKTLDGDLKFDYVIYASPLGSVNVGVPTNIRYNRAEIYVVRGSMKNKYDRDQRILLSNGSNIDGITRHGEDLFTVHSSRGNPGFDEFFDYFDILDVHKWKKALPVLPSDAQFPKLQYGRLFFAGDFYLPGMEMPVATAKKAVEMIYQDSK